MPAILPFCYAKKATTHLQIQHVEQDGPSCNGLDRIYTVFDGTYHFLCRQFCSTFFWSGFEQSAPDRHHHRLSRGRVHGDLYSDGVEEDIDEIQEDVEEIQEDVGEIEKDLDDIQKDVDEIEKDVDEIQKDIDEIEKDDSAEEVHGVQSKQTLDKIESRLVKLLTHLEKMKDDMRQDIK